MNGMMLPSTRLKKLRELEGKTDYVGLGVAGCYVVYWPVKGTWHKYACVDRKTGEIVQYTQGVGRSAKSVTPLGFQKFHIDRRINHISYSWRKENGHCS